MPTDTTTRTRLILAPMEGVIDAVMREMLTALGGIDRCVTEFVRVSQTKLPSRVFYRLCPELRNDGCTASGVPVYLQLLGSDPGLMAANAQVAAKLGAPGIDLNFGCPAKTVNKSEGGAVLLRRPQLVGAVCRAVRDAVPQEVPVTAKIRLGFDDDGDFERVLEQLEDTGIDELVVHARTRRQGYRPSAHWHRLQVARQQLPFPVIANGELWSPGDVQQCQAVSGCTDFMLARGALCRPDLPAAVRASLDGLPHEPLAWSTVQEMLQYFLEANAQAYERRYAVNPVKQWLVYLKHYYPQAAALFAETKRINDPDDMAEALRDYPKAVAA
jgi:tRNA-dihydrouridine synthase C